MSAAWYRRASARDALLLSIRLAPGAKRTEVAGLNGDALKIRVAAPPRDGEANEALVDFIAERLGVPRRAVRIVSGARSRSKVVEVSGAAADPGAALWPGEP